MKIYNIECPRIGKRGAVSMYGTLVVEDEESKQKIVCRIDLPKGQLWNRKHDELLVELAEKLGVKVFG